MRNASNSVDAGPIVNTTLEINCCLSRGQRSFRATSLSRLRITVLHAVLSTDAGSTLIDGSHISRARVSTLSLDFCGICDLYFKK